eukprot:Platyproteum_vivax@DN3390_c0_g1_i1.p1
MAHPANYSYKKNQHSESIVNPMRHINRRLEKDTASLLYAPKDRVLDRRPVSDVYGDAPTYIREAPFVRGPKRHKEKLPSPVVPLMRPEPHRSLPEPQGYRLAGYDPRVDSHVLKPANRVASAKPVQKHMPPQPSTRIINPLSETALASPLPQLQDTRQETRQPPRYRPYSLPRHGERRTFLKEGDSAMRHAQKLLDEEVVVNSRSRRQHEAITTFLAAERDRELDRPVGQRYGMTIASAHKIAIGSKRDNEFENITSGVGPKSVSRRPVQYVKPTLLSPPLLPKTHPQVNSYVPERCFLPESVMRHMENIENQLSRQIDNNAHERKAVVVRREDLEFEVTSAITNVMKFQTRSAKEPAESKESTRVPEEFAGWGLLYDKRKNLDTAKRQNNTEDPPPVVLSRESQAKMEALNRAKREASERRALGIVRSKFPPAGNISDTLNLKQDHGIEDDFTYHRRWFVDNTTECDGPLIEELVKTGALIPVETESPNRSPRGGIGPKPDFLRIHSSPFLQLKSRPLDVEIEKKCDLPPPPKNMRSRADYGDSRGPIKPDNTGSFTSSRKGSLKSPPRLDLTFPEKEEGREDGRLEEEFKSGSEERTRIQQLLKMRKERDELRLEEIRRAFLEKRESRLAYEEKKKKKKKKSTLR